MVIRVAPLSKFFALLLSMILCLTLVSCEIEPTLPSNIEDKEIYGSWKLEGPDDQHSTLIFKDNGTVQIENLPSDAFHSDSLVTDISKLSWTDSINLMGSWVLVDDAGSPVVRITGDESFGNHKLWFAIQEDEKILTALAGGGGGIVDMKFFYQGVS
ncbi:hypothetical protein ABIB48_000410 [Arthrobacter sp. UYCu511]|uniref:hypothetical protein n=1 Tax=Arthrobacter sp. UYCu511 TaxID=3156337 RepID=UPI003390DA5C